MADVTLAECNGNVWLVSGEQHVAMLLYNNLPPDVSVELVSCDSLEQVRQIWIQNCGEPLSPCDPILINPAIADRVRRNTPGGRTIYFAQWSAMLDEDAVILLQAVAGWLNGAPALQAKLVSFIAPDSLPGVPELFQLRVTLIRRKLAEFGVAADRLGHEVRAPDENGGAQQESQRVGLEVAEPGA